MFTPNYISKGAWDILNRGNILKLFKNIPALCTIMTKDLEKVSFIPSCVAPGGESTVITLRESSISGRILGESEQFLKWGVHLTGLNQSRYPHILEGTGIDRQSIRNSETVGHHGCLRGAVGQDDPRRASAKQISPTNFNTLHLGTVTITGNRRQITLGDSGGIQQDWSWLGASLNQAKYPHS